MKLKVVWIGKTKEPAIDTLTADYLKRIGHYAQADASAVKDEAAILKLCSTSAKPKHTLILLDSRGKQFSSEEFAGWLRDYQDRNPAPLLLAIGPALLAIARRSPVAPGHARPVGTPAGLGRFGPVDLRARE